MAALQYLVLLPILAAILVHGAVISTGPSTSIITNGVTDQINCDSLICPNASVACTYTEKNSQYNQSIIVVTRNCLNINGTVIDSLNTTFVDTSGNSYDISIYSGQGAPANVSLPDVGQLKNRTEQIQKELDSKIQKILSKIEKELGKIEKKMFN